MPAISRASSTSTLWKPGTAILRISISRFNRICLALAALWLALTIPLGLILRPTLDDFGQFYLGGVIAAQGRWEALYPTPNPASINNPGLNGDSWPKPGWISLRQRHGMVDWTHFMLPPPSALLFTPLSFLSRNQAFAAWIFLSCACIWGVAALSARILRFLLRRPSRYEGLLALSIVLSPMTARAIRIANVSPMIGLSFAVTIYALLARRSQTLGAVSVALAAALKYASLVLMPLLIAMRRWKMIAVTLALGAALLAATLIVAGTAPFSEFFHMIAPLLSRTSAYPGNQTLPGFLARVFGRPFSPVLSLTLRALAASTLGAMLTLLFLTRRSSWRNPVYVLAAAAMLISWLLIFSPIAWEHWDVFLCPVWGWLLWEGRAPGPRRALATGALVLSFFPAGIIQVPGIAAYAVVFPEPLNSTQLVASILVFALAFSRMSRAGSRNPAPADVVP